jgi:hypothetical protein
MISKTWVTPPVGSGSAGIPSRTTKRSANPFSSNRSTKLPTDLSLSPPDQSRSCPLTLSGAGR